MSRKFWTASSGLDRGREDGPPRNDAAALGEPDVLRPAVPRACAVLFNFAQSGHPGGSVSSGTLRREPALRRDGLRHLAPNRLDADLLSYAAGHKALGLYAMLALRDEVVRVGAPDLLPAEANLRMRFEDLLGFRRNPTHPGPLFRRFGSKPLDGHPTPATPFVKLATGASGMGCRLLAGSRRSPPPTSSGRMRPGSTSSKARAASRRAAWPKRSRLRHTGVDAERLDPPGLEPGLHRLRRRHPRGQRPRRLRAVGPAGVLLPARLERGRGGRRASISASIRAAQRRALEFDNGQPTAIVYRTVKGWRYGIEGQEVPRRRAQALLPGVREDARRAARRRGRRRPALRAWLLLRTSSSSATGRPWRSSADSWSRTPRPAATSRATSGAPPSA